MGHAISADVTPWKTLSTQHDVVVCNHFSTAWMTIFCWKFSHKPFVAANTSLNLQNFVALLFSGQKSYNVKTFLFRRSYLNGHQHRNAKRAPRQRFWFAENRRLMSQQSENQAWKITTHISGTNENIFTHSNSSMAKSEIKNIFWCPHPVLIKKTKLASKIS